MAEHMLTTIDNPHNPFTHWDEWYVFDESAGYHSTSLLARVVKTSYDISEADQSQAIEDAIEQIVNENVSGVHKKISMENVVSIGGEGSP